MLTLDANTTQMITYAVIALLSWLATHYFKIPNPFGPKSPTPAVPGPVTPGTDPLDGHPLLQALRQLLMGGNVEAAYGLVNHTAEATATPEVAKK